MAAGQSFFNIGGFDISPDNTLLAYSVDTVSRRQYKIYFKNLKTGKLYPEEITMAGGPMVWAGDNKTVFYPAIDESLRFYKIFRHVLGTPAKNDIQIFHESDDTFSVYVRSEPVQEIYLYRLEQHADLRVPLPGGKPAAGRIHGLPAAHSRPRIRS